jgi:hypothetical protein
MGYYYYNSAYHKRPAGPVKKKAAKKKSAKKKAARKRATKAK